MLLQNKSFYNFAYIQGYLYISFILRHFPLLVHFLFCSYPSFGHFPHLVTSLFPSPPYFHHLPIFNTSLFWSLPSFHHIPPLVTYLFLSLPSFGHFPTFSQFPHLLRSATRWPTCSPTAAFLENSAGVSSSPSAKSTTRSLSPT